MLIDPIRLEALKVWYATFTVIMDAHADREYSDATALEKLKIVRDKLKELVPEGEPVKPN